MCLTNQVYFKPQVYRKYWRNMEIWKQKKSPQDGGPARRSWGWWKATGRLARLWTENGGRSYQDCSSTHQAHRTTAPLASAEKVTIQRAEKKGQERKGEAAEKQEIKVQERSWGGGERRKGGSIFARGKINHTTTREQQHLVYFGTKKPNRCII